MWGLRACGCLADETGAAKILMEAAQTDSPRPCVTALDAIFRGRGMDLIAFSRSGTEGSATLRKTCFSRARRGRRPAPQRQGPPPIGSASPKAARPSRWTCPRGRVARPPPTRASTSQRMGAMAKADPLKARRGSSRGRRTMTMVIVDVHQVRRIQAALPASIKAHLQEALSVRETAWVRLRDACPVRLSASERLMRPGRRCRAGCGVAPELRLLEGRYWLAPPARRSASRLTSQTSCRPAGGSRAAKVVLPAIRVVLGAFLGRSCARLPWPIDAHPRGKRKSRLYSELFGEPGLFRSRTGVCDRGQFCALWVCAQRRNGESKRRERVQS